ncbi:MAG: magnesium chelatase domain-containing protein, partial [Candidatus Micrarchaeota archaeon]
MIRSAILRGLEAIPIDVEIAMSPGRGFRVVGLPRQAVKESQDRLMHAIHAAGYDWPDSSITINLAPADIPKAESSLELSLALAILEASGQVRNRYGGVVYVVGELGLDGRVKRCHGVLSMGRMVPEGSVLIAPKDNEYELALLKYIKGA